MDAATRSNNMDALFSHVQSVSEGFYQFQRTLENGEDFAKFSHEDLVQRYYNPMVGLIASYFRDQKDEYKAIGVNELFRYLPGRVSDSERDLYLEKLSDGFKGVLRQYLPESYTPLIEEFFASVRDLAADKPVTLITVGDCLMTELHVYLRQDMHAEEISCRMHSLYFSADQGVNLSSDGIKEALTTHKADILGLSFLTYEGLPIYRLLKEQCGRFSEQDLQNKVRDVVGVMESYIAEIRSMSNITILLHNVGGLPLSPLRAQTPLISPFSKAEQRLIDAINQEVSALVERTDNCLLLDEHAIVTEIGARKANKATLPKDLSRNAMFHPSHFGYHLSKEYARYIKAYDQLKGCKLLAVDFDNTLWKGVMADEPVEHHHDRQKLLKRLKESGILLAAVSKNDEKNILWQDMSLDQDDFVSHKINWNLKPQSIEELAQELNLGKDSFLFIDDNPVERELVQSQHPLVRCFDPDDPEFWQMLEMMFEFPSTNNTQEARNRTNMYKAQASRSQAMSGGGSTYSDMMGSLELKLHFRPVQEADMARFHELVDRTNQFNTTTIRYSLQELQQFNRSADHSLYVAELSDKFGHLGIVAVAILERGTDSLTIDSFIMSCRAMGFGMEKVFLQQLLTAESWQGRVIGKFATTPKNEPASRLYPETGFVQQGDEWLLDSAENLKGIPMWFEIIKA